MTGAKHNNSDRGQRRWFVLAVLLLMMGPFAAASGPRFVTGTRYWVPSGQPMPFFTSSPLYFTDPGTLSASLSHAQADAMVAAAAAVWNVPSATLTLAQGGALAEHVSRANTYLGANGVVFPQDVQAANYPAKPIAVIYDADGSITDLLLGSGASDPSGCRQSGVTESSDGFGLDGTLQHAVIVLNGRCVGAAPEQMLQMQYQVMRAFGRALGLSWAQVNDTVFTGASAPTANELANWPVMHPIDVVCGLYTYQCMTSPWTLRPDDLSSLALLYSVRPENLTADKVYSSTGAVQLDGTLQFPTGQGMSLVNVTVHRLLNGHAQAEPWQMTSAVSGYEYQNNTGNPVTGTEVANDDTGTSYQPAEGFFEVQRTPADGGGNFSISTEPINPLYIGEWAVGPYQRPPVTPSGSVQTATDYSATANSGVRFTVTAGDAASSCTTGSDGTEAEPAAANTNGLWTGLLCAAGHSSWWSVSVKAGHTWTLEVTAQDEAGIATLNKVQPVLGVWHANDATGTLPSVAAAPVAMNSLAVGMTQLHVAAASADSSYRLVVADQFGAGRPDFAYAARLLYADAVSPAALPAPGGQITITGEGFRSGNRVLVNGVAATVLSWTATKIVALAPTQAAARASKGVPVAVEVLDAQTNGSSTMAAALNYGTVVVNTMMLVSAPSSLETGLAAATPFAVRVLLPDGVTPAVGASVQLSVTAGAAGYGGCSGAATCVLLTDATGRVSSAAIGGTAGAVTLTATELSGGATLQVSLRDVDPQRSVAIADAPRYVAAGGSASWPVLLTTLQDGLPAAGATVSWTATTPLSVTPATESTDASGRAAVTVSAVSAAGASTSILTGCAWTNVCASWTVYGVDASLWRISVVSGAGQSVAPGTTLAPVTLLVTDTAGHPLAGAPVTVYQAVYGWEGACPAQGRCPAAPVLATSGVSVVADVNGLVTVTPLVVAGQPQVVQVAAAAGPAGFCSLALNQTP